MLTNLPDTSFAMAKGWISFREPEPRINSRAEYWREYCRKNREKVRAWKRNHYHKYRKNQVRINQPTGIKVSQHEDNRLYHRLYMRLRRKGQLNPTGENLGRRI